MWAGTAYRLARRAGRRRADGTLTWRARRAWERLAATRSRDGIVAQAADRPDRVLTGGEADYLSRQVADARDWERLWRLVPAMPLASAVRAARLFPNWRPADDLGRAFFTRLAGTDPDAITALGQAAVTSLKRPYPRGWWKRRPSFAPDNSEVCFEGTLFTLPGGHMVAHYETTAQELALGHATIVHMPFERSYGWTVIRNAPGRSPETLLRGPDHPYIGRTPGGFVVAAHDKLWFGNATRSWSRVARVRWPADVVTSGKILLAADPVSGNLAFLVGNGDGDDLVLVDANGQPLARAQLDDGFRHVYAFYGPDQVLAESSHPAVGLWRRDGSDLVLAAAAEVDANVVPVPSRNLVVIRREGKLGWLDASTLAEVDPPAGFPVLDSQMVSFSPDGSLVAAKVEDRVEVHNLGLHQLADLAARSLSQARVTDLEAVAELRERKVAPHVRPAVELLHAGLAYRFGADVALGSGTRIVGGASDIALGGQ